MYGSGSHGGREHRSRRLSSASRQNAASQTSRDNQRAWYIGEDGVQYYHDGNGWVLYQNNAEAAQDNTQGTAYQPAAREDDATYNPVQDLGMAAPQSPIGSTYGSPSTSIVAAGSFYGAHPDVAHRGGRRRESVNEYVAGMRRDTGCVTNRNPTEGILAIRRMNEQGQFWGGNRVVGPEVQFSGESGGTESDRRDRDRSDQGGSRRERRSSHVSSKRTRKHSRDRSRRE